MSGRAKRPSFSAGFGRTEYPVALDQLTPRVSMRKLRRIAGYHMQNERPGRSMQTTALVHEAYLKLIDVTTVDWRHRAHFFAVSSQIMRENFCSTGPAGVQPTSAGASRHASTWTRFPMCRPAVRVPKWIALDDALNALAQF